MQSQEDLIKIQIEQQETERRLQELLRQRKRRERESICYAILMAILSAITSLAVSSYVTREKNPQPIQIHMDHPKQEQRPGGLP